MKIGILGYGRMGKEIHTILDERGHQIVFKGNSFPSASELKDVEVCIEFTKPEAAADNIARLAQNGVAVVCGTTGWLKDWEATTQKVLDHKSGLVYASNFSLGVNLFFAFSAKLAATMNGYQQYEPKITEIHHTQKLDAPSGTAITLAQTTMAELETYKAWELVTEFNDVTNNQKSLPIKAIREDKVPGTHSLEFVSEIDTIEVKHTAHSRKGFALGAVIAAEWVVNKKGIFSMQDVLGLK